MTPASGPSKQGIVGHRIQGYTERSATLATDGTAYECALATINGPTAGKDHKHVTWLIGNEEHIFGRLRPPTLELALIRDVCGEAENLGRARTGTALCEALSETGQTKDLDGEA